jgi:hypothetical protein
MIHRTLLVGVVVVMFAAISSAAEYQVGVATIEITPAYPDEERLKSK